MKHVGVFARSALLGFIAFFASSSALAGCSDGVIDETTVSCDMPASGTTAHTCVAYGALSPSQANDARSSCAGNVVDACATTSIVGTCVVQTDPGSSADAPVTTYFYTGSAAAADEATCTSPDNGGAWTAG